MEAPTSLITTLSFDSQLTGVLEWSAFISRSSWADSAPRHTRSSHGTHTYIGSYRPPEGTFSAVIHQLGPTSKDLAPTIGDLNTPTSLSTTRLFAAFCCQQKTETEAMALTILMFYTRRPDFTPQQFRDHMESKYLPIVKEVMGPHSPQSTTLRYIERCGSGFGDRLGATLASKYKNHPDLPVCLVGYPKDLGWDAMVEMSFKDDLHLMQGYAATNSAEGQKIRDAEDEFTVPDAMKVVLMDRSVVTESNA